MHSFKDYILCTLLRHKAGSLHDTVIIFFGSAVLLALRRPLGHQRRGVHLHPMHLCTGKGDPRTFNANRPLYDLKSWAGTHKTLHEIQVAAGHWLGKPQTDYEVLHGQFGCLVQLDQLLKLVARASDVLSQDIEIRTTSPLSSLLRLGRTLRHVI